MDRERGEGERGKETRALISLKKGWYTFNDWRKEKKEEKKNKTKYNNNNKTPPPLKKDQMKKCKQTNVTNVPWPHLRFVPGKSWTRALLNLSWPVSDSRRVSPRRITRSLCTAPNPS